MIFIYLQQHVFTLIKDLMYSNTLSEEQIFRSQSQFSISLSSSQIRYDPVCALTIFFQTRLVVVTNLVQDLAGCQYQFRRWTSQCWTYCHFQFYFTSFSLILSGTCLLTDFTIQFRFVFRFHFPGHYAKCSCLSKSNVLYNRHSFI